MMLALAQAAQKVQVKIMVNDRTWAERRMLTWVRAQEELTRAKEESARAKELARTRARTRTWARARANEEEARTWALEEPRKWMETEAEAQAEVQARAPAKARAEEMAQTLVEAQPREDAHPARAWEWGGHWLEHNGHY